MTCRSKLGQSLISLSVTVSLYIFLHVPMDKRTQVPTEALFLSAYLIPELNGIVRVIGASKVEPPPVFTCHYANKMGRFFFSSIAPYSRILPKEDVQYDGLFVDCPPSNGESPFFVAVSTYGSNLTKLRVLRIPDSTLKVPSLAACVCPLFGEELSERQIVSWIEMNRLLGVEHFVFYNYSAPSRLIPLFKHYSQLGLVELIEWDLNPIPVAMTGSWPPARDKLHYFGQFVANNDCLHRMRNQFKFVMFSDLDELLLPTSPKQTLNELLTSLDGYFYHAFLFRGTYVRNDFKDKNEEESVRFLRYIRRERRILPPDLAPKLIVKPHLLIKVFVHDVEAGFISFMRTLSPREGLLFHYKNPPRYLDDPMDGGVTDDRVLRYRNALLTNIDRSFRAIRKVTGSFKRPHF